MTPRQFRNRLNGWEQAKETERQERWEQTRAIAYNAIAPNLHERDRDPLRYMPFRWDEKPKSHEPDPEAIKQLFKGAREVWGMNLSPRLEKFVEGSDTDRPKTDTSPA